MVPLPLTFSSPEDHRPSLGIILIGAALLISPIPETHPEI